MHLIDPDGALLGVVADALLCPTRPAAPPSRYPTCHHRSTPAPTPTRRYPRVLLEFPVQDAQLVHCDEHGHCMAATAAVVRQEAVPESKHALRSAPQVAVTVGVAYRCVRTVCPER